MRVNVNSPLVTSNEPCVITKGKSSDFPCSFRVCVCIVLIIFIQVSCL